MIKRNINNTNGNLDGDSHVQESARKASPKSKKRTGETQESRCCRSTQSSRAPAIELGAIWRRRWKVQWEGLTVGLDIGDRYSFYCVLNEQAEVHERALAA